MADTNGASTEKKEERGEAPRSRGSASGSKAKPSSRLFGNYLVTPEVIGNGQYGKVFLGHHKDTQKPVAVKAVRASMGSIGEVREMQRLNGHPNIVRLLDQQQNEKFMVLILEYCDGGDLQKLIDSKRLVGQEHLSKRLFHQLLNGLSAIRSKEGMHRDLKPANILLCGTELETAVVKIADLGMAKSADAPDGGMFLSFAGTPGYMAPERLRNDPYDFSAEIWAAGCILYEMVYGQRPYNARSAPELLRMCAKQPPFPTEAAGGSPVSDACIDLLSQMLRFQPKERIDISAALHHPWFAGMQERPSGSPVSPTPAVSVRTPVTNAPKISIGTSPLHSTKVDHFEPPAVRQPAVPIHFDPIPYVDPLKTMPKKDAPVSPLLLPQGSNSRGAPTTMASVGGQRQVELPTALPPNPIADPRPLDFVVEPTASKQSLDTPTASRDILRSDSGTHHRTLSEAERPESVPPENFSITAIGNGILQQTATLMEHAQVVKRVASQETEPCRAAVLYAYACSILRDACGDEVQVLRAQCAMQARSLISRVKRGTECKTPAELLLGFALRTGREAATEEQFENHHCGPNGDLIADVYRLGRAIVDVVLVHEAEDLTSDEAASIQRLAVQFDHRIAAVAGKS